MFYLLWAMGLKTLTSIRCVRTSHLNIDAIFHYVAYLAFGNIVVALTLDILCVQAAYSTVTSLGHNAMKLAPCTDRGSFRQHFYSWVSQWPCGRQLCMGLIRMVSQLSDLNAKVTETSAKTVRARPIFHGSTPCNSTHMTWSSSPLRWVGTTS
jgi:hypothetical protein